MSKLLHSIGKTIKSSAGIAREDSSNASHNAGNQNSAVSNDVEALLNREYRLTNSCVVIDQLISEGGFGYVFRGHVTPSGQPCAVKRMTVRDEQKKIAELEMKIMHTLIGCPNIVRMLDCGLRLIRPGVSEALIAMELCSGGHLFKMISDRGKRRFAEQDVYRIFSDICLAVCFMHKQNPPIVHRDLKVENVLYTEEGFKLCDFGSAQIGEVIPTSSNMYTIEDDIEKNTTMRYRAPEMVDLYSGKAIGPKADVWALGSVLFMISFFDLPFEDSKLSIMSGKYRIPENNNYSANLLSLLSYILVLDPDRRPNIFQVTSRVFMLRNIPCPIELPNLTPSESATVDSQPSSTQQPSDKPPAINRANTSHQLPTSATMAMPTPQHRSSVPAIAPFVNPVPAPQIAVVDAPAGAVRRERPKAGAPAPQLSSGAGSGGTNVVPTFGMTLPPNSAFRQQHMRMKSEPIQGLPPMQTQQQQQQSQASEDPFSPTFNVGGTSTNTGFDFDPFNAHTAPLNSPTNPFFSPSQSNTPRFGSPIPATTTSQSSLTADPFVPRRASASATTSQPNLPAADPFDDPFSTSFWNSTIVDPMKPTVGSPARHPSARDDSDPFSNLLSK